ncbi:hypothetical protein [Flavobacterium sp.]|uniref:hypothetical protein n=1 Tax=Flavobacterium sp. TaxID=239 RepID=UPI00375016F8
MKKLFCGVTTLASLILIFLILQSCEKEIANDQCTTCESKDYVLSETKLLTKDFTLKKFTDKQSGYTFMYKQQEDFNELSYLFDELKLKKIELESILGIIVFTKNQEINKKHEYNIKKKDIKGVLLYLKK